MFLSELIGWAPKSLCVVEQDDSVTGIELKFYPSVDDMIKYVLLTTYEDGSIHMLPDEVKEIACELRGRFECTISTHNEFTFLLWAKTQNLNDIVDWYMDVCGRWFGGHMKFASKEEAVAWLEEHPSAVYVVKSVFIHGMANGSKTNGSPLITTLLSGDFDKNDNRIDKQTVQNYAKMTHLLKTINTAKYSDVKNVISLLSAQNSDAENEDSVRNFVFSELISSMHVI